MRARGSVRPKAEPIDAVAILYDIQVAAADPLGGSAFMTPGQFLPPGTEDPRRPRRAPDREGDAGRCRRRPAPRGRRGAAAGAGAAADALALLRDSSTPSCADRAAFHPLVALRRRVADPAPADVSSRGPSSSRGSSRSRGRSGTSSAHCARWPSVQQIFQDGPGMRAADEGISCRGARHLRPAAGADPPAADAVLRQPRHPRTGLRPERRAAESRTSATLIVLPSPETLFPLLRHCLSRFEPEELQRFPSLPAAAHAAVRVLQQPHGGRRLHGRAARVRARLRFLRPASVRQEHPPGRAPRRPPASFSTRWRNGWRRVPDAAGS